jgi:hypothetical protein
MNKFSKVTIGLLMGSLAISALNAESKLVFDGVDANTTASYMVASDIKSSKAENVNLTFKPKVNGTKGSTFELQFKNGGYEDIPKILMCSQGHPVGLMYSQGDDYSDTDHIMPNPRFQFNSDVNESLIIAESNITFHQGDDNCSTPNPAIVSNAGACSTITAVVDEAKTTTGLEFKDYKTNIITIGKTKKMVQIACETPVCTIDATQESKLFTTAITPSGINQSLNTQTAANRNASDFTNCPTCEEAGAAPCTVTITVNNISPETNLTSFTLNTKFKDEDGKDASITLANTMVNGVAYTHGSSSTINFTAPVSPGNEQNITISYIPNKTAVLNAGALTGSITAMGTTTQANDVTEKKFEDDKITTFQVAGKTKFTVPYMNAALSGMVRISAPHNNGETPVSAVITDVKGKTCSVNLTAIPANGAIMVFPKTKAGRTGSDYQNLIEVGECTNLESKEFSVVFTTSTSVDVVSYMTMSNGSQRYVDVY